MNKVILLGRLVKDPEFTQSQTGMEITKITIAVDRHSKGEKTADFINCVAFGKTAIFISSYFEKGKMIAITGNLKIDSWVDKDNVKKYSTNVIVEECYFCGDKATPTQQSNQPTSKQSDADESLPF
jgi:single-strand DNA-binding protein